MSLNYVLVYLSTITFLSIFNIHHLYYMYLIYTHKCLITHTSSQTWSCLLYFLSLNKDSHCRNYWSIHACKSMYVHSKSNMDFYSGIPRIASQNENIWKPPTNPWLISTLTTVYLKTVFIHFKGPLKKQETMGAVRSFGGGSSYGFVRIQFPGSRYLPPTHSSHTLPETNGKFAPENGWLEDEFSFGAPLFSGANC